MFASSDVGRVVLELLDSLISDAPDELPSIKAMLEYVHSFCDDKSLTDSQAHAALLDLISQALKLEKRTQESISLVDYQKKIRRAVRASSDTPLTTRILKQPYVVEIQSAIERSCSYLGVSRNFVNLSSGNRLQFVSTQTVNFENSIFREDATIFGYIEDGFSLDLRLDVYLDGVLEANIFLSELLLRSAWRVTKYGDNQLNSVLMELIRFLSLISAACRRKMVK